MSIAGSDVIIDVIRSAKIINLKQITTMLSMPM